MRLGSLVYCLTLALTPALRAQTNLTITLAHNSPAEQQTRDQLLRLLKTYGTQGWTFTRKIVVDDSAIPHSDPVLTLHTRHRKDDELLLSTYVHEQLHWFLKSRPAATDSAMAELRALFPAVPIGYPDGSSDETANYAHLLICYLEYRADRQLLGELQAQQVMTFWAGDHYRWIYRAVLDRTRDVGLVAFKHKLVPGVGGS